jgi:hypothetical protein
MAMSNPHQIQANKTNYNDEVICTKDKANNPNATLQ